MVAKQFSGRIAIFKNDNAPNHATKNFTELNNGYFSDDEHLICPSQSRDFYIIVHLKSNLGQVESLYPPSSLKELKIVLAEE